MGLLQPFAAISAAMVRLTLLSRVHDGLPLAEGLDNEKDRDLDQYKLQAKVQRAHHALDCCMQDTFFSALFKQCMATNTPLALNGCLYGSCQHLTLPDIMLHAPDTVQKDGSGEAAQ